MKTNVTDVKFMYLPSTFINFVKLNLIQFLFLLPYFEFYNLMDYKAHLHVYWKGTKKRIFHPIVSKPIVQFAMKQL